MPTTTALSTIIALARAGALEHAWYEFGAAGYDAHDADPAALTVKGRLLKDRAIRAKGEERRSLYLQSAEAYRRAAELQSGTYPLINAATLSLLSGDRDQAGEIAREVMARIAREPDEPETPYWRAATEAEALLLLGRLDEARSALEAAISAAPRAWEDHASTLRQFVLIHDELGADPAWLDILRPPRSLAYRGGALPDDKVETELRRHVADIVVHERIGFVFGALGAGAEIVAAEAALEAGAELHVVLPGGTEAFARDCVEPAAASWRSRFDAAVAAAESVHMVRPIGSRPTATMLALAQRIASGAARLNAERLMSEALCLDVGTDAPAPTYRAFADLPPSRPIEPEDGAFRPLALLSVSIADADDDARSETRLSELHGVLAGFGSAAVPPHLVGDNVLVGFEQVDEAARAAGAVNAALRDTMPLRIAAHYGFIPLVRDPFVGAARPSESGARIVKAIAEAAPPDTICVSLDFAAALAAGAAGPSCAHWIGELHAFDGGTSIALYSLRPLASDD